MNDRRPGDLQYTCWGESAPRRPRATDVMSTPAPGGLRYAPEFEAHCRDLARKRAADELERREYIYKYERRRLLEQYEQSRRNDHGGKI